PIYRSHLHAPLPISSRGDPRSRPSPPGTAPPCCPTSSTSLPSGSMLRSVRNRSMSSLALETQSCAASGPVISVSCSSGGVISEMPLLPATSADDDDDAWCDELVDE